MKNYTNRSYKQLLNLILLIMVISYSTPILANEKTAAHQEIAYFVGYHLQNSSQWERTNAPYEYRFFHISLDKHRVKRKHKRRSIKHHKKQPAAYIYVKKTTICIPCLTIKCCEKKPSCCKQNKKKKAYAK